MFCVLCTFSETFSSSLAKARFKLGSQGRQVGYKVAAISVRVQRLLCAERREEADTGAHPGTRPAEWIWMLEAGCTRAWSDLEHNVVRTLFLDRSTRVRLLLYGKAVFFHPRLQPGLSHPAPKCHILQQ